MKSHTPDVEIWHARAATDSIGAFEEYCAKFLSAEEHDSAARFKVISARNQHVIGRSMARNLLCGQDCQTSDIQFETLPHGKPILHQPEELRRSFNLAHTKGLVMCGIGQPSRYGEWIGIDVEWLDRRTDPGLANRYFAKMEIQQLEQTNNETEYRELFLRLWTLKESFIKAIGTGLTTPLDQFGFENASSRHPQLHCFAPELSHGRHWQFECFNVLDGFVSSVAIGRKTDVPPEQPIDVRIRDFERFLQSGI